MAEIEKNRGGRPRVDATPITVRVAPRQLAALDAYVAAQPEPRPSRPEAIRSLLDDGLAALGHLPMDSVDAGPDASDDDAATERYADADPDENVMVTGVGPMTLRRAIRKRTDWREHHGLDLVSVYRGADKEPSVFDVADLDALAETERFR